MTPRPRILVLGSGGREHALAWRLERDPEAPEVLAAPGNDGMGRSIRRLAVAELDAGAVTRACRDEGVTLAVIGPEAPLAMGVSDALREAGIPVFGASRECARLETSKWFAKELMREAGVPTARAECFDRLDSARAALDRFGPPFVIKADGLAAGKGVLVNSSRHAAEAFLSECLESGRFGESGRRVVLEEFLEGEEASVMAICDGARFMLLPPARDYKRAFDGDRGPNTGGMGAFAPTPAVDVRIEQQVASRIVAPTLATMERRGTPYRGALYCGVMLGESGPKVVEFNVRLGDPETEAVMPLLEGSLSRLLASAAAGELDPAALRRSAGAAVAVALVDEGYPDRVRCGGELRGLEELMERGEVMVFHAGSAWQEERWRVRGGRAAFVVARRDRVEDARHDAYAAIAQLKGGGWRCRSDIAAAASVAHGTRTAGPQ